MTYRIQIISFLPRSIEQSAQNDARCLEQKARGELERAKLLNEKEAEKERCKLLELRAVTAAVESAGQAVAEAQAKKESMIIECESQIIGKIPFYQFFRVFIFVCR